MIRCAIIDDHEIVWEALRTVLQSEPDFEVVAESGSANDIVGLVESANPDVVLLDSRLPGLSGPDACRRASRQRCRPRRRAGFDPVRAVTAPFSAWA